MLLQQAALRESRSADVAEKLTLRLFLERRFGVEDAEGAHKLAELHHVVLFQIEEHEQLRAYTLAHSLCKHARLGPEYPRLPEKMTQQRLLVME